MGGRLKFRIKNIVYVAISRGETISEFAFPKDWRAALVESQPENAPELVAVACLR